MKRFSFAVLLALFLPAAAAAHVSVRPALLESGEEVLLRIELPGLRPGQDPSALAVSGPGVRAISSERSGRVGEESRWRVLVDVRTPPGPLPLLLVARYPDGRSVSVRQTLTVLPSETAEQGKPPVLALLLGLVGLVAAAVAALAVRRARAHE
ncbi:MAG TPA: hypothetical protein VNI55_13145 [Gaiellaceae bacterium]|nr:hypothetical protein [Gaiellaceae bacterium]